MKKLLTIILSVILAFGAFALVGCGKTDTMTNETSDGTSSIKTLSVKSVTAPKIGGKIISNYTTRSGQAGISKRITATVLPADAANKTVDYRLFWISDAERADEPVSDYVVIEQDSDGSASATITCIQPFGTDKIIAQVVTREGKYTSECVLTYEGLISEMAITSSTLNTVNTAERGDYYELYTGNTYTFTVDMDNELHNVGAYDLSVSTGGNGEFWFARLANYETHTQSMISTTGWFTFAPSKINLNDISDKFITATVSGNQVTVSVNSKALNNYYEENSSKSRDYMYFGEEPIYVMEGLSQTYDWLYSNSQQRKENAQNLPSAYFTLTVTDSRTNVSQTIKLWVESGVDSVSLSTQSIVF